jgi:hypothetical protein
VASLPAWAQQQITSLRQEAAKARTGAKEQAAREAREELLRQLSGDAPEPLTPEQLQARLSETEGTAQAATAQALAARIELDVHRTATRLGADAERLLDSRAFCDEIDGIEVDPADRAGFLAAVEAKVMAALTRNPGLRAGPAAAVSGSAGGSGGSGADALTIDAQIEAATKARNFAEVIRLKRAKAHTP